MKRLQSILRAALFVLLSVVGVNTASATKYECATLDELLNALTVHNGYMDTILVTQDFNLEGKKVGLNVKSIFRGVLDGQNHTIYNGTIKGALIYNFKDGMISNLNFKNITSKLADEDDEYRFNNTILVQVAENATFCNINFANCKIKDAEEHVTDKVALVVGVADKCWVKNCNATDCYIYSLTELGSFVAEAHECKIYNCHAKNIDIDGNDDVGGIAGFARSSIISDCTVSGEVQFYYHGGGIVGGTEKGTVSNCINYAKINCHDYRAGGIVGNQAYEEGTIVNCVNFGEVKYASVIIDMWESNDDMGGIVGRSTGTVKQCINHGYVHNGDDKFGGIVGNKNGGKIIGCINTGTVDADEATGGIVGYLENSSLQYCLNTGSVDGSPAGVCIGERKGSATASDYYWLADSNFDPTTSSEKTSGITQDELKSGMLAYYVNNASGQNLWGQAMHPDGSYVDEYPVPGAAVVYRHEANCKNEAIVYYNNYNNNHYGEMSMDASGNYVCAYCNGIVDCTDDANAIVISTAAELQNFATAIAPKQPKAHAILRADIDCSELTWTPIGDATTPFCGTFDGQNHRISNLAIQTTDNAGLFGCVGNGATIKNLFIDASCSINATGKGAGAIAGCVWSGAGSTCDVTILNCGNEADVQADSNAGGILGGVYNNTNTAITIKNCYNTGAVIGQSESASICGYAGRNLTIQNCWNSGVVAGVEQGKTFVRYTANEGTVTITNNCSTFEAQEEDGVTLVYDDDIESGELCWVLNGKADGHQNGWYQYLNDNIRDFQPTWIVEEGVYRHENTYCDGEALTQYDNSANEPEVAHTYDDDGFCTRMAGETHYKKPDTNQDETTYYISIPGNLYWFAENLNNGTVSGNCQLTKDITVNRELYVDGVLNSDLSDMRQWTPIGTAEYPYKNYTFDGQGHTISGLYFDKGTVKCVGLFGVANSSAIITNVGVVDSYFNSTYSTASTDYPFVGAIVGCGTTTDRKETTGAIIRNCYSTGDVRGGYYTGGIAGALNLGTDYTSKLVNVFSACTVTTEFTSSTTGSLFGELFTTDGAEYTGKLSGTVYYLENTSTGTAVYGAPITALQMKSGYLTKQLISNVLENGLQYPWQQNIGTDACPSFGGNGIYHKREVLASRQWGTIVVPFTLTSDDDVAFYTIRNVGTENNAIIKLKKAETVAPNTPCFFGRNADKKSDETVTLDFYDTNFDFTMPEASQVTETVTLADGRSLDFVGIYEDAASLISSADNYLYYLAQDKMWRGDEAFSLAAYRAYIQMPKSTSDAKAFTFSIDDDDTDGISIVNDDDNDDDNIYNIAGQRVGKNAKGILIINGKKVLVK